MSNNTFHNSNNLHHRSRLKQALIAAIALSSAGLAGAQSCEPRFRLNDLGALNDASVSWASGINRYGAVVGGSHTGETWSSPQSAFIHAYGTMRALSTPQGSQSTAYGINNLGQVAGIVSTPAGESHAVIWGWGGMRYLGDLGFPQAEARDINDFGQVAGQAVLPDYAGQRAVIFSNNGVTDLGTLGGDFSYADAINGAGQVVGASTLTPDGWEQHAFVYSNGQMRDLGTIGCPGNYTVATAINDLGEVVGLGDNECGERELTRGFMHRNGQMIDLGDLGWGDALPRAINNRSEVIGVASVGDGNIAFFFWKNGTMYNLGQLIVNPGNWSLSSIDDINDRGDIVGQAYLDDGTGELVAHAIKLSPTFPACN